MPPRLVSRLASSLALAGLAAVTARPAQAQPPTPAAPAAPAPRAACAVDIILARSDGDGTIDPQLSALVEDLKRPPLNAWKTFKRLDRKDSSLSEGATATFNTPSGRPGSLTYLGVVRRGPRNAVKVALDFPGEKSNARPHITLDDGGHFLVAGLKHQGGILIYALSCKTGP